MSDPAIWVEVIISLGARNQIERFNIRPDFSRTVL